MTLDITVDGNVTDKSTLVDADRIPIIDSETNPDSFKETKWSNLKATLVTALSTLTGTASDWKEISASWTYASASTITVPSGAASLYQKGDALRLKQGGSYKYFSIIIVADTLLTVTAGNVYTVDNAAITDIAINRTANPFGHPIWFDTGTVTVTVSTMDDGADGQPTTVTSRFRIAGNVCTHKLKITGTKAGTGQSITYTNPSNMPAHTEANLISLGSCYIGNANFAGVLITQTSTTRTLLSADSITDNQTLAGGVTAIYSYEF